MIWGKLLGGVFGFLIGGPLGAILGAALGHPFDASQRARLSHQESFDDLSPGDADRVRMTFFTALFSVMGHVAKADGRVDPSEIALAEAVMARMSLTPELRDAAIKLFNQGKQPEFQLAPVIEQFRSEARGRTNLYRIFLEIQIQAAYADGIMTADEEVVVLQISRGLGFPDFVFRQLEILVRVSINAAGGSARHHDGPGEGSADSAHSGSSRHAGDRGGTGSRRQAPSAAATMSLADAYGVLGIDAGADKATVKRAYRRLMSQHHPDKLVSKGLPEEMIELATDKTQNIQKAYARIKEARGF